MIKDFELGDIPDFSPLIFIRVYGEVMDTNDGGAERIQRVPRGFVFIKNEKEFGADAVYKLVSEHPKRGETPFDTAVRGLRGETNLSPPLDAFSYVGKWLIKGQDRPDHWQLLFTVDIHERELPWMNSNHPENEGEVPKFFTMYDLLEVVRQGKFMKEHYKKLLEYGLLLPRSDISSAASAA